MYVVYMGMAQGLNRLRERIASRCLCIYMHSFNCLLNQQAPQAKKKNYLLPFICNYHEPIDNLLNNFIYVLEYILFDHLFIYYTRHYTLIYLNACKQTHIDLPHSTVMVYGLYVMNELIMLARAHKQI